MQIALRILVLLLALGAGGLSGYVAYLWMNQVQSGQGKFDDQRSNLDLLRMQVKAQQRAPSVLQDEEAKFAENTKDHIQKMRVLPFMYGGAIVGLLGGLLAVGGRPLCASGLFLVGFLAPLAVYQSYWLRIPTLLTESSRPEWQTDLFAVLAVGGLFLCTVLARLTPSTPESGVESSADLTETE